MRVSLAQFTCLRAPGGLRVWSRPGFTVAPRTQEILCALDRPAGADVDILKSSTRRSVLRVRGLGAACPSLVIKGFPLHKLESKLKYRKYGLTEFLNYETAAARAIPLPRCHAYFEVRSFGLVRANGVIIEDLHGWQTLADLARENPGGQPILFAATLPLFRILFDQGVNHIDATPQNLLQSPDGAAICLIDWQYCSFVAPRQPAQLVLQASHFLSSAGLKADTPDATGWLDALFNACSPGIDPAAFRRAVAALRDRGRISATDRLALALDDRTRAIIGTRPTP